MNVPEPLPRRLSFQQDHWGYFNHETSNTGLIPFWIAPRQNRRQTNFQYTQLGTLKSIKYPTGGMTAFTYESHESIASFDNVDQPDPGRNYVADSGGGPSSVSFATILGPDPPKPCLVLGLACNTFENIILKFRAGSPTGGVYNLDYKQFMNSPAIEIYRVGETRPIYRYDFGYLVDCAAGDINCSIYSGGQPGKNFRKSAGSYRSNFQPVST